MQIKDSCDRTELAASMPKAQTTHRSHKSLSMSRRPVCQDVLNRVMFIYEDDNTCSYVRTSADTTYTTRILLCMHDTI